MIVGRRIGYSRRIGNVDLSIGHRSFADQPDWARPPRLHEPSAGNGGPRIAFDANVASVRPPQFVERLSKASVAGLRLDLTLGVRRQNPNPGLRPRRERQRRSRRLARDNFAYRTE